MGDDVMTVRECERIHAAMMGEIDARFDASAKDREELHRHTASIFADLKKLLYWFLGIGGMVIMLLLSIAGTLIHGGGFARNVELQAVKEKQAKHEAVSEANNQMLQMINRKISGADK